MSVAPDLAACLPARLRGPTTTITRLAAGLSGAGVYRVAAAGQTFVLKVASEEAPLADWRQRLEILQHAVGAGVAPRVVHADEERRAVPSAFVADQSFPARFADPRTRESALVQLGRTIRRVHALPLRPGAEALDPRARLAGVWAQLADGFALPSFVAEAVERVLAEPAPARERALVSSHNDVNPSNLVLDGEKLLLLDWDTAAPNDPFYDLAAAALFFRMDEATCKRLLAAYDDAPVAPLPARFAYLRRLLAVLCGAVFVTLARRGGHAGAGAPPATLASTPSLAEVYQRMRAGTLSAASAEGQWLFGLALVKASAQP